MEENIILLHRLTTEFIFAAVRCGKTAVRLCAFQGFAVPPGGEKTGDEVQCLVGGEITGKAKEKWNILLTEPKAA